MKNTLIIVLSGLLLCTIILFIDKHIKSESQHDYIMKQQQTIKQLNNQLFEEELNK